MDERLIKLAQENPIVYRALSHATRGDLSLEAALTECVIILVKMNKEQFDLLVDIQMKNIGPSHFISKIMNENEYGQ